MGTLGTWAKIEASPTGGAGKIYCQHHDGEGLSGGG